MTSFSDRPEASGSDDRSGAETASNDGQRLGWNATLGKRGVSRTALAILGLAVVVWVGLVLSGPGAPSPTGEAILPSATVPAEGLPVGPFLLWRGAGVSNEVSVILPTAGWLGTPGDGTLLKNEDPKNPDAAGILVLADTEDESSAPRGVSVAADPCRWSTTTPAGPLETPEAAAAALASQASTQPTRPVDIVVGGHPGKAVTLRVPADLDLARCDQGEFRMLRFGPDNGRSGFVPGQIDELWIVRAGTPAHLLIFDLVYDDAISPRLVDEVHVIVESATFG